MVLTGSPLDSGKPVYYLLFLFPSKSKFSGKLFCIVFVTPLTTFQAKGHLGVFVVGLACNETHWDHDLFSDYNSVETEVTNIQKSTVKIKASMDKASKHIDSTELYLQYFLESGVLSVQQIHRFYLGV